MRAYSKHQHPAPWGIDLRCEMGCLPITEGKSTLFDVYILRYNDESTKLKLLVPAVNESVRSLVDSVTIDNGFNSGLDWLELVYYEEMTWNTIRKI